MPTSLYVLTPGDLVYVKPDGVDVVRTYQVSPNGSFTEVNRNASRPQQPDAFTTATLPNVLDPDTPMLPKTNLKR